jgi:hypothetical protein
VIAGSPQEEVIEKDGRGGARQRCLRKKKPMVSRGSRNTRERTAQTKKQTAQLHRC